MPDPGRVTILLEGPVDTAALVQAYAVQQGFTIAGVKQSSGHTSKQSLRLFLNDVETTGWGLLVKGDDSCYLVQKFDEYHVVLVCKRGKQPHFVVQSMSSEEFWTLANEYLAAKGKIYNLFPSSKARENLYHHTREEVIEILGEEWEERIPEVEEKKR